MQALLFESTMNLVPESDLTLNLRPVSLLNKKKALLDVAIAKPKQSNREQGNRQQGQDHQHQFCEWRVKWIAVQMGLDELCTRMLGKS